MYGDDNRPGADEEMVIEWAPFRLAPGIGEDRLLEVSEALQRDFLQGRPGFVRRELLRGADGHWVDLLYWRDEASAHAVMEDIAASPACQAYFSLMVGADTVDPGAGVLHLHRMRSYGSATV
jgi:hypothetical protein